LRVNIHHQVEPLDPEQRIKDADEKVARMKDFSGIVQNTPSAINSLQSGFDTVDTVSSLVAPLKMFNSIANEIANVLDVYLYPVID